MRALSAFGPMILLAGPCMLVAPVVVVLLPVLIVLWPFALTLVGVLYLLIWPFALLAAALRSHWLPKQHAALGALFAVLLRPWNYFDLPQKKDQ